jgi:hypothetical protein
MVAYYMPRGATVIDVDPDEHEAKMQLAEIYKILNEKQLALDLVNQGDSESPNKQ